MRFVSRPRPQSFSLANLAQVGHRSVAPQTPWNFHEIHRRTDKSKGGRICQRKNVLAHPQTLFIPPFTRVGSQVQSLPRPPCPNADSPGDCRARASERRQSGGLSSTGIRTQTVRGTVGHGHQYKVRGNPSTASDGGPSAHRHDPAFPTRSTRASIIPDNRPGSSRRAAAPASRQNRAGAPHAGSVLDARGRRIRD